MYNAGLDIFISLHTGHFENSFGRNMKIDIPMYKVPCTLCDLNFSNRPHQFKR